MDETIVRERASEIIRILGKCRSKLAQGDVYACLASFRKVLEKTLVTRMLPADEKDVQDSINDFQRLLMASVAFRNTFGPVTFQENSNETTLSFVKELVHVSEEDLADNSITADDGSDNDSLVVRVKRFIDGGEFEKARECIGDNEDLLTFIIQAYNDVAVYSRQNGDLDRAYKELNKALCLCPDDEGLLYNMARVHVEKLAWTLAEESIQKALQCNPGFYEGLQMLDYILDHQKATA